VAFYKRAKAVFDKDDDFKDEARRAVVKLQASAPCTPYTPLTRR
jgi:hypothetical protein